MSLSICINCGHKKRNSVSKCGRCDFTPSNDLDKAKSLSLSLDYEIDGEYLGKSKEELLEISGNIEKGDVFEFDSQEMEKIISYAKEIQSISAKNIIGDIFKWLFPAVILVFTLLFLAR